MSEKECSGSEPTAVDDVRRVRERIAREYQGDLQKHVEATNRKAAALRAKLKVRMVAPVGPDVRRAGAGRASTRGRAGGGSGR